MDELFETVTPTETVTIDESVNYLEVLVGEGRKFKTPEELAKGKYHADQTIEQMKSELTQLKTELNTRMSLETFRTELETLRRTPETVPNTVVQPDAGNGQKVDAANIKTLLEEFIAERETKKKAETNVERVARVLADQFGDINRAKLVLNNKANELGMSVQDLQGIAQRSPDALFRIIGVTEGETNRVAPTVPQSRFNMPSTTAAPSGARGRSYYEKLKASDWKKYNSFETEKAMMNDMATLGRERFNSM